MNVSLYIIGTELTRGIITDKHTPLLTAELTKLGYTVKRSVLVPDDGTIEKSLALGVTDSDVLLITGGLGPTSDDMTRKIIASLAGMKLEKNKEAWDTLYARVGERIYGANEQQTMIPHGFDIIPNPKGTAPGFKGSILKDGRTVFIAAMPGPPAEMQPMFFNYVQPMLSDLIGYHHAKERDEYSVFLIAEAKLEELCSQVADELNLRGRIEWGTRFQTFRISLYINGNDEGERQAFIARLRKITGEGLIEDGNVEAVELLTDYLAQNNLTISCAESATSGFLSKTLTDKAGASDWFWGGVASYSREAKIRILKVDEKEIETNGTVTEECALQMASGMQKLSGTDVAVSITGIAGPSGEENGKGLGTVCIGFASKNKNAQAVMIKTFWHSREAARRRFLVASLILTRLYLEGCKIIDIISHWLYI